MEIGSHRVLLAAGLLLAGCGADAPAEVTTPVARAAATPAPATAEMVEATETAIVARVESLEGAAEHMRDGEWEAAAVGDELALDDAIRVPAGGIAVLALGADMTVEVTEETEVTVRELSEVARLRLEEGRVEVDVRSGMMVVETSGGAMVTAEDDAAFAALASEEGDLSVASRRGSVDVTGVTRTVEISAGELTVVERGGEPAVPRPVPASIFLKVARPVKETDAASVTLKGKSLAGARISIGEVTVAAGADGTFDAEVPLRKGDNRFEVRALDATGREATAKVPGIKRVAGDPDIDARTKWGVPPATP